MSLLEQPPVFCDNCSTLALATLHLAPLCESCLVAAVKDSKDPKLIEAISPLSFKPSRPPMDNGLTPPNN